jgi:hypothetical protein
MLVSTWSVGVLGVMHAGADIYWAALSSGPFMSCCSLADSFGALGEPYVGVCHPELGFASSCFGSVVIMCLIGRCLDKVYVLVVCFGCVVFAERLHVYVFWVRFSL